MLLAYTLIVDITSLDPIDTEEQFRAKVSSPLACLDSLKGAFDQSPCKKSFHRHAFQNEELEAGFWSVRAIVMISIGKKRSGFLLELYSSIAEMIKKDLSADFDVKYENAAFSGS